MDDDSDATKVTHLKSVPEREKDELTAATEGIMRALPSLLVAQEAIAKMQRARYLALLEEGFNDDQAIKIVSKMTLTV